MLDAPTPQLRRQCVCAPPLGYTRNKSCQLHERQPPVILATSHLPSFAALTALSASLAVNTQSCTKLRLRKDKVQCGRSYLWWLHLLPTHAR